MYIYIIYVYVSIGCVFFWGRGVYIYNISVCVNVQSYIMTAELQSVCVFVYICITRC